MTKSMDNADVLYDRSAGSWARSGPILLSDFTARPAILELCEPVKGAAVLDLGCGEGYCSRQLMTRGAAKVTGIDISTGMIELAREGESKEPRGIQYFEGCGTDLSRFQDSELDLVLAVFLFNYLTINQMRECMVEVARVLRPDGQFVFSVPHPALPHVRGEEPPFYFSPEGKGYFSGRDAQFRGHMWKRDGTSVEVRLYHKIFQDYFECLRASGFNSMPTILELCVTSDMVDLDPAFFGPLVDTPLHVAMKVAR